MIAAPRRVSGGFRSDSDRESSLGKRVGIVGLIRRALSELATVRSGLGVFIKLRGGDEVIQRIAHPALSESLITQRTAGMVRPGDRHACVEISAPPPALRARSCRSLFAQEHSIPVILEELLLT
jgi:hypothetical protein